MAINIRRCRGTPWPTTPLFAGMNGSLPPWTEKWRCAYGSKITR
jgi:hypothetical protein